ncbi:MAG: hypothetical protein JO161_02570 [Planctomycetaceae bacterium]|nr:hypothetical protein [Planctomycetaceae bacterium]
MDVEQIQAAILNLQPDEFKDLMAWLGSYCAQAWDKQIAEDLESGRLDPLLAEVDKEYDAGLARPL